MYRNLSYALLVIVLMGSAFAQSNKKPNKAFSESLGIKWVLIPGGTFEMGDVFGDGTKNQKPVHTVTVSSYYLSATEVTFTQYDAFCEATGRSKPTDSWGRGNLPVESVNWNDAVAFCKWLSEETGFEVRLPTEAEWEYAARSGGKKEKWAGTSNKGSVGQYAWTNKNSKKQAHPVGSKRPNSLGLYDMSGNMWEWCADWSDKYSKTRKDLPPGVVVHEIRPGQPIRISDGNVDYKGDSFMGQGVRVIRGGAWGENFVEIRTTYRSAHLPQRSDWNIGIRLARTP